MPGVRDKLNCSFTACRVGIRKCWRWVQCHRPITSLVLVIQDQYNVICLGLSGTGKSTLLAQLVGEPLCQIEPTTGFNIKTLPFGDTVLSIKELGGSHAVQNFWDNYFTDKHAILFVVNAASPEADLNASKEALQSVLVDQRLKNKPCLIVGTHSDLSDTRSTQELEKYFASIMQNRKWAVVCCSAHDTQQIHEALEMLIDLLITNSG